MKMFGDTLGTVCVFLDFDTPQYLAKCLSPNAKRFSLMEFYGGSQGQNTSQIPKHAPNFKNTSWNPKNAPDSKHVPEFKSTPQNLKRYFPETKFYDMVWILGCILSPQGTILLACDTRSQTASQNHMQQVLQRSPLQAFSLLRGL